MSIVFLPPSTFFLLSLALEWREAQEATDSLSRQARQVLGSWRSAWPSIVRWVALQAMLLYWLLARDVSTREAGATLSATGVVAEPASEAEDHGPLGGLNHDAVHAHLRRQQQVRRTDGNILVLGLDS